MEEHDRVDSDKVVYLTQSYYTNYESTILPSRPVLRKRLFRCERAFKQSRRPQAHPSITNCITNPTDIKGLTRPIYHSTKRPKKLLTREEHNTRTK